jgi:hypothetical protein
MTQAHLELDAEGTHLAARHREKVSRALSRYLASSGDFTYSLVLRRHNRRIDPTLDFLVNVRQGHCERFAAGLALMLRSLGIPSRIVQGFRGAEHEGDGKYVVRQSHAHTWVEALVPAQALDGRLAWLTLEPTPGHEAAAAGSVSWSQFWENAWTSAEYLWRALIIESNPENRRRAAEALVERLRGVAAWAGDSFSGQFWTKPGFWVMSLPAGFLLLWIGWRCGGRRFIDRARSPGIAVDFYARLLRILARRCRLQPQPAQTPREFGETARRLLEQSPTAASLAELPGQVAGLYYQVRFGRQELSEADGQEIDRQLDDLDQILAAT